MKIAHLTSVHAPGDARIFVKMCRSLAAAGHDVHLVAPGCAPAEEMRDGVRIHRVALPPGRFGRMRGAPARVFGRGEELKADLYHFHDPELLRGALAFRRRTGRPLVYDAHEDTRLQILGKPYLPPLVRGAAAKAFGRLEDRVVARLDGVVAATPDVARRFENAGVPCAVVRNFPILEEFAAVAPEGGEPGRFVYVGDLSAMRGVREMVRAVGLTGEEARLSLGGKWETDALCRETRSLPGWERVEDLGWLDRPGVAAALERASAGIVLLEPRPNYVTSWPVKMFEYMAAGRAVIASDFPLWREIVETAGCGLLVEPRSAQALAGAMRWMIEHPDETFAMGARGRETVTQRWQWRREFEKLEALYRRLDRRGP